MFGRQRSVFENFEKNYKEKEKNIIDLLRNKGVKVIMPKKVDNVAEGITFEMTGKPSAERWKKKEEFIKYATQYGLIHTELNKDCKILFCEDKNSSSGKIEKARRYGTLILNYDDVDSIKEFLAL
jgi:hypothetical protein